MEALALDGDVKPLVEYTEKVLQELAVRDAVRFDEKYLKAIFTSAVFNSGVYTIRNEFEVKVPMKAGHTGKGFVDLLLLERPPYHPNFQAVMEFKYVKKKDANQAENVKQKAIKQLQNYLQRDDFLSKLDKLKAFVIVFVGYKGEVIELKW